jgi:hypothetical protein
MQSYAVLRILAYGYPRVNWYVELTLNPDRKGEHQGQKESWTLHALVKDFVAQEDVVGVFPPAGVEEPKRCGGIACENRDALP